MVNALQFLSNGKDDHESVCQFFSSIEVEESVDLPGAMEITLPLNATNARDLTFLASSTIQPYANISLVANTGIGSSECIFDGYVLSHKVHLETGTTNSTVKVWCQDASWLLNLQERVHTWENMTDREVAEEIFKRYDIAPAEENRNLGEDDDTHHYAEDKHILVQRESDMQLLRRLARRTGKFCRVFCKDNSNKRYGYFAGPNLEAAPAVALILNPARIANVYALDFEWDVARPYEVGADQSFLHTTGVESFFNLDAASKDPSGLKLLEARSMAEFLQPQFVRVRLDADYAPNALLTTVVDSQQELALRARSMLREAGFFVKCKGEADVAQLKAVLRAGMIVDIQGAGSIHSGKYYVWSVRHSIGPHNHKMNFVLVRNAVGAPPPGGV